MSRPDIYDDVRVTPKGHDEASLAHIRETVLSHALFKRVLEKSRFRILHLSAVIAEDKAVEERKSDDYQCVVYDYDKERAVTFRGRVGHPELLESTVSYKQPPPTEEEFAEAVRILSRDPAFAPALSQGALTPYPPMPPLVDTPRDDGTSERVIAVGLKSKDKSHAHQIVGVHLGRETTAQFKSGAPPCSLALGTICGAPNAGQPTTPRGTAGSYEVNISNLWKFTVVRPSVSSGTNGSGIELQSVYYKGKKVLHRAHVPILNVLYDQNACGPYRDWQYQEGMFNATGTDVAPGIRLCTSPPTTIMDTNNDTGNFKGVALYKETSGAMLIVSELEAGWYRYISQWRFFPDGRIQPRFGFAAVNNSCVCNTHHHHVYWRFDFDIVTASNNIVREFNDPPLIGSSNWHTKVAEIRRAKDSTRKRKWRIENAATGEAYDLVPGMHDGTADSWGVGDVWVLRYHGTSEVDDGQGFTTDPSLAMAHIDKFVNGESVEGQDVVVWYGAHFTHDLTVEASHIVGPELVLVKW